MSDARAIASAARWVREADPEEVAAQLVQLRRTARQARRFRTERDQTLSALHGWERLAFRQQATSLPFSYGDTSPDTSQTDVLAALIERNGPVETAHELRRVRREAARYRSALRALSGEDDDR